MIKTLCLKEMNTQKNTQNLNLKEENSSRSYIGDYHGRLLKSSFNSVLPRFRFFFVVIKRLLSVSFFPTAHFS